MQAKAHVSIPVHTGPRSQESVLAKAWSKFKGYLVMEAPDGWDVHPDVQRLLDERALNVTR